MHIRKMDIINAFFLLLISFLLTFDLFLTSGQASTFDGRMHSTMIAQIYRGLSEGEVRVSWSDGFGNYGMPMALIHHQVAVHVGAIINFLVQNVVISYDIVYLIGAFLSCLFFYIFLRIYTSPISALVGTFFFNFTSYRIINLYTRGAQPEFFASVFLPLILIGIYYLIQKKKLFALFLLVFSVAFLILSHPFVFIIHSFIFIPYIVFNILLTKKKVKSFLITFFAFILGIGLTAYYTIPLIKEIKYFYYGSSSNHLALNQFMSLENYLSPNWHYFYRDNPLVRGNFLSFGLFETLILFASFIFAVYMIFKRRYNKYSLLFFCLLISSVIIFLTTKYSLFLYERFSFLANIQHPWRMFSALLFIPPFLLSFYLNKIGFRLQLFIAVGLMILISILRFPQIYGKNFVKYPENYYFYTKDNVAGVVLNPVWTAKAEEYSTKDNKIEIIEGKGKVKKKIIKNSSRMYEIDAQTPLRVVDYTFYFPGWNLFIDKKSTSIEFQDPRYRGIITYRVPAGFHRINLIFQNTKTRTVANSISSLFLLLVIMLFVGRKYLKNYVFT